MLRKALGRYLKSGLINMEGPRHRLVRRICGPLFSGGNIRGMMPTFLEKGEQVCCGTFSPFPLAFYRMPVN
jgi:cytochrome P450